MSQISKRSDIQSADPPPEERPTHWATDPLRRWLYLALGPLVVLLAGLYNHRGQSDSLTSFLISYPVMAPALVLAGLWIGELGAADYEGRPEPKNRRVFALVALGVAIATIPIVAGIRQGFFPIGIEVLMVVAVGFILLVLIPGSLSPNWVLVPIACVSGAVMAGLVLLTSALGSLWSSEDGADSGFLAFVAWVVIALMTYLGLALMTETRKLEPLPTSAIVNGALATLTASVACFLLMSFSLSV